MVMSQYANPSDAKDGDITSGSVSCRKVTDEEYDPAHHNTRCDPIPIPFVCQDMPKEAGLRQ